ncbi:MAG: sigma 54-interacting transcriptional regulator [bacterium]
MRRIKNYNLLHPVAEGSHGVLYRAEKEGLPYAVKVFKSGAPLLVLEEAKVLSQFSHPNIVRYVEQGNDKKISFLVTEWVEGKALETFPPSPDFPFLLRVTLDLLKGLHALHRKGWVHGDLKGANVLITAKGAKLIDLGLSRSSLPEKAQYASGTLATLAPELFFGQPPRRTSDFYSLGIVLYRWVTGRYPFPSSSVSEVIRWHLFETPSFPVEDHGEVPPEFADFILRLLSKNPSDRHQSVGEIFEWLRERFNLQDPETFELAAGMEAEEGFELHGEAILYYENKADLKPEERLILAELHYQQGHLPRALKVLETLCNPRALLLRAKILTRQGEFTEAEGLLEKVGPLAGDFSVAENIAYLNAQGVLRFYQERTQEALERFSEAEVLSRQSGELTPLAVAYNNLANGILAKGEKELAEEYFLRSIELARKAGDRIHEGMFQMSLGFYFHQVGRFGEALSAYGESLRILEKVGQKSEKARTLLNRANLMLKLGGLEEAETDLKIAQEIFKARSLDYLYAYSLLIEGEIFQKRKQWREARDCFEEAERRLSSLGRKIDVGYARLHRIEICLEAGDKESAMHSLFFLPEQGGFSSNGLEGHFHLLEARILIAFGEDPDGVERKLHESKLYFEKMEEEEALPFLHQVWGSFLLSRRRNLAALEHFQEAKNRLEGNLKRIPPEWKERYRAGSLLRELEEETRRAEMDPSVEEGREPMKEAAIYSLEESKLALGFKSLFEKEVMKLLEDLVGELDLNSLVDKILDRTIQLTEAERGFILLNEHNIPRVAASRNLDQETLKDTKGQISHSIATEVLKTGEAILTVDALVDERFSITASVHQLKLRSILCLPFTKDQKVLGALYLDNREKPGIFHPSLSHALKPFTDLIAQVIDNAHRFLKVESDLKNTRKKLEAAQAELKGKYDYHNIVGRHPRILELFKVLDRVTDVEVPVLIIGESGVGKELVAKAIHFNGERSSRNFVSINCKGVHEELFESELFGHVRGAFTGAVADRVGLLEMAHQGTLFLDEIAEMPLALQGKLLRILQEGRYRRVGDKEERSVDCRVLSATQWDLRQRVKDGKFREDLFFQLGVVEISVPPLRERREDLPLLADHFLAEFARWHGGSKKKISPEAMDLLMRYDWPGNVRELENTLTNACVFSENEKINPEAFRYKTEWMDGGGITEKGYNNKEIEDNLRDLKSFSDAKKEFEKRVFAQALREADGNITQAAMRLKMARPQLSKMIKKYGIEI